MVPNSPRFRTGHSLHQIQTRKAFEDRGSWQTVTLLHASEGRIAVRSSDGATHWYECGDFPRFLAALHLAPGPITEPPHLMLASRWGVLMVPPGGARSMTDAAIEGILPAFELRGGSVVAALTAPPGGKVPLFGIAPSEAVERVEAPPAAVPSSDAGGSTSEFDDDEPLSDRVEAEGELVAYRSWNGGFPGGSGSIRVFSYKGQYYVRDDERFHGPFLSKDEATQKFAVLNPIDEIDADDATDEIWDGERGTLFRRKSD